MRRKRRQRRPARRRRWLAWAGVVLIFLFAADFVAYPLVVHPSGPSRNSGANGLWLSDSLFSAPANAVQVDALCHRLNSHHIRYAYLHTGSVAPDGRMALPTLPAAGKLVRVIHQKAPGVSVLAWVYAGNSRGHGRVDLANPSVRVAMAREAAWLVTKCGFDGVQWDYEICPDGDPSLIALLKQTRAAMPPGKLLSVATPMWVPIGFRRWGWDESYFGMVARRCDQISVMCYDSGIWWPRGYVWLVEEQAVHVTRAVARSEPECSVLLGVPTYAAGGLSHDSYSENLCLALIGVRDGLNSTDARPSAFAGVAVFADYTTTPADWRTYARLWPLSYSRTRLQYFLIAFAV